ncbi:MAG: FHA domain-containing protein [Acidobacteria bacterium]|nr:FHA domain-containing protein [Acidobacteriota bacterium]
MAGEWWKKIKDYVGHLDEDFDEIESQKPPQKWNDLLIRIAREIEQVMLAEMFEPPGEPTYIPPEYIVFLSPTDDVALTGDKRIGFLRGLRNITAERAKQIVGTGKTQTDKICVEFRVDSSLADGQFYVKASWDVQQEPTTVRVSPRRQALESLDEATVVVSDDELTEIRRRPLFHIEVSRDDGSAPTVHAIFKPEVRIGRGGKSVRVDVPLSEDREISRLHAILNQAAEGYEIHMKGKNPMIVAGAELQPGDSVAVRPGDLIKIGTYTLKIGPDMTQSESSIEKGSDESNERFERSGPYSRTSNE